MVFADVMIVVFVILGLFLALPSYWLMVMSLWPAWSGEIHARVARTPGRCLAAGVPAGGALLFLSIVLMNAPAGVAKVAGVLFLGASIGLALVGAGGLAARVGAGLASPRDDGRPWMRVVKGGAALELTFLIPVLGWFLVLPITLLLGVGAGLLGLIRPIGAPESPVEPMSRTAAEGGLVNSSIRDE